MCARKALEPTSRNTNHELEAMWSPRSRALRPSSFLDDRASWRPRFYRIMRRAFIRRVGGITGDCAEALLEVIETVSLVSILIALA
jgi:hypothetical protein